MGRGGVGRGGNHRNGARGGKGAWGPQEEGIPGDEDGFDPAAGAEEAEGEDDSDAADDELAQKCALPVSGGPLPPSDEPPKDADEYLRRVMWERMHLSETVDVEVAEKPPRQRKNQSNRVSLLTKFDAPEIPEHLQHCAVWAEDVVAAFRDLRTKCADARESHLDGSDEAALENTSFSADAWRVQFLQGRPTTSLLAMQDIVSLHKLFAEAVDAFVETQDAANTTTSLDGDARASASQEAQEPPEVSSVAGAFGPDSFLAEWVFAVLAFVDEPLVDDMMYQLQRLRRTCQKAIVASHARSEAGAGEVDSKAHAQATLLLTVVREHFGQR